MRFKLTIIISFFSLLTFAQNEVSNWYFGEKAGLKFENGRVNILNDGKINAPAGCSSISDENGNLLFYTNGNTIWNKNHEIMENGESIGGDINIFQNSIIIPKPNDNSTFYVISTLSKPSQSPLLTPGLFISEVIINNLFPLGKVISKFSRIRGNTTERVTAIHKKNGKDILLISFGKLSSSSEKNDTFFIYEITELGFNRQPKIIKIDDEISEKGSMKVSPDGKTLAIADYNERYIHLYNFNTNTINLEFRKKFSTDLFGVPLPPLGIEFSPSSNSLFYSAYGVIMQHPFYLVDPNDPFSDSNRIVGTFPFNQFGALQLGIDNRIYVSTYQDNNGVISSNPKIGAIENSDSFSPTLKFNNTQIDLQNGKSLKGLPNFIVSFFRNRIITENKCVFEAFDFSFDSYVEVSSVKWDFGDGITSKERTPSHIYTIAGQYTVKAVLTTIYNKKIQIFKRIKVHPLPELIKNQELNQCDDNDDGISIFNLNNITPKISNNNSLTYKFYSSLSDAQNETNEILNPENYTNISNPQTLYIKAYSNYNCSEIESFSIQTLYKPSINLDPIIVCEDSDSDLNNLKGDFDLRRKRDEIINLLNLPNTEKISFYPTKNDALKSTNKLPIRFNSGSTTIWVKIENNNGCSGISPIELIVNNLPPIDLKDLYTICINPFDHPPIIISADNENNRYEWVDDKNNVLSVEREFTLTRAGDFRLNIYKTENGLECTNSKKFSVKYPTPPIFQSIEVEANNEIDNSIFITVEGSSSYEFSLDNINYFGNGQSHTFNNISPGLYNIYVRDLKKCEASISSQASIIGYPKFFTPNSDGKNDSWIVYGANAKLFKNINIRIFNRFGKTLYVINNNNTDYGWDGTYNGKILPSDDYWFYAKLIDLNGNLIEKKGHISLQRN
ncbi:hypothetical protein WH52_06410 [Tenacibaculum holothuriorum]|uniref:PKD domain-containing protein n=1 Tax=Tenacibaculum holothuriorum TaxID=1635173 RepID=A0A1Y2PFE7_9FLAO|nr:T9SS type B sorting domain-containing protein [Tenacibaculum holothuriorum]OSY88388.1 hypothetical protein WH52_06410 [Tenacibaculum holothuriorum]